MMALLAKLGGGLLGPLLKTVTLPALVFGLCLSLYQLHIKRQDEVRDNIETAATNQCNQSWLLAVSKRKERDAAAKALVAQDLLEGERRVNEELSNDLAKIRAEHAVLAERVGAGTDARCLSDGVLESLRRNGRLVPGGKGSEGGGSRKQ